MIHRQNTGLSTLAITLALTVLFISCDDGVSSDRNDDPGPTTPETQVTGTFTYSPVAVIQGGTANRLPDWSDAPSEQTVTYSIDPSLPEGLSIDETTGEIKIEATAGLQPKTEYIVIATGTGDYKGSRPFGVVDRGFKGKGRLCLGGRRKPSPWAAPSPKLNSSME